MSRMDESLEAELWAARDRKAIYLFIYSRDKARNKEIREGKGRGGLKC